MTEYASNIHFLYTFVTKMRMMTRKLQEVLEMYIWMVRRMTGNLMVDMIGMISRLLGT